MATVSPPISFFRAVFALAVLSATCWAVEFRGTISGTDHKPLAGARVLLLSDHDGTGYGSAVLGLTETDKDGRYRLDATAPGFEPLVLAPRPSLLILIITCAGHAPAAVLTNFNDHNPIDIELASGRTLTCKVTSDKGPLPGAKVHLTGVAPSQLLGKPIGLTCLPNAPLASVSVAADGRATLPNVPQTKVTLRVSAEGYAPGFVRVKKQDTEIAIRLSPARQLKGTVKDEAAGTPLPGMVVCFGMSSASPVRWAITDDKGHYSITVPRSPLGTASVVALDPRPTPQYAPASAPLPDTAADKDALLVDLGMPRGHAIHGRIIHEKTKAPLPGITVQLRGGQGNIKILRRTGAKGLYRGVTTGGWMAVKPLPMPPPGLILNSQLPNAKWIWVLENKQVADIALLFQRALAVVFLVRDADGEPVPGARVSAQYGTGPPREATADGAGRARFSDVPADTEFIVHGANPTYTAGAFRAALIPADKPDHLMDIRLQPTATLAISTTDANGWPLPAHVELWLDQKQAAAAGDAPGPALAIRVLSRKINGDAVLPGLLPGVQYRISALAAAPKARMRGPRRLQKTVTLAAGKKNPAIDFRFNARQTSQPRTLKPHVSIEKQIADLGKTLWSKKDTVDPKLTWIKIEGGLALADRGRKEVRKFFHFFGYRRLTVNAIAFTKDKVWIGADKGLFAWDRAARFWTRYAVNAALLEVNVSDLKTSDKQELVVTVSPADEPRTIYIYNPADMRWRPQGKAQ